MSAQRRSGYAYFWAGLALAVWGFLLWQVVYKRPFILPGPAGWDNVQLWTATALVALLASAPVMHAFDRLLNGRGFASQHAAAGAELQLDDGTVSGLLSVQSIRTAVTTFILTALVGLIPKKDGLPVWSVVSRFHRALGVTIGFMLLVSLVTTLVATLCLDYSIRFAWNPQDEAQKLTARNTKLSLRVKARALNEIGFYCLMWPLAALPAFLSAYACLSATLLVYAGTWWYYFFPDNKQLRTTSMAPSEPLATAIATLISKASEQVSATASSQAATQAKDSATKAESAASKAEEAAASAQSASAAAHAAAKRLEDQPKRGGGVSGPASTP